MIITHSSYAVTRHGQGTAFPATRFELGALVSNEGGWMPTLTELAHAHVGWPAQHCHTITTTISVMVAASGMRAIEQFPLPAPSHPAFYTSGQH